MQRKSAAFGLSPSEVLALLVFMSGHSKWSKVKHFKGKIDATRSRAFSRCGKEIAIAARIGGGDPNFNPRLRTAIAAGKAENMPSENIERAIKRGTGEIEGIHYEEALYEGYAPGGVAVIVEVTTDNKNRTAAEIRSIFTKHGGNLAAPGAVAFQFSRKGTITVPKSRVSEDDLMPIVLDAGADDLNSDEENFEIITPVEAFDAVVESLKKKNLEPSRAQLAYVPQNQVPIGDESTARKMLVLLDALDEHDDVQRIHSNFDIPDTILEKIHAG
jgi:YebC/PmpR family DNA-binding regulatory protein